MKHDLAAMRVGDRLVGQLDASLIERGDDLVSGENVGTTDRLALDIRHIGEERTRMLLLGAVESFLRARKHLMHIGRMAGRGDTADSACHGDRAGRGDDDVVADRT